MSKAKFHPKLHMIIERHERNKAALFVPDDSGVVDIGYKPRYLPAEQQEQTERVEKAYRDELAKLKEEAERAFHDAQLTIARLENPYRWLSRDEAIQAHALAPFVREDFQRAGDVKALLALTKRAATGDKVDRWLAQRYVLERVEELAKAGVFAAEEKKLTPKAIELVALRDELEMQEARLKMSLLSDMDKRTLDAAKQRQREAIEIRDGLQILSTLGV